MTRHYITGGGWSTSLGDRVHHHSPFQSHCDATLYPAGGWSVWATALDADALVLDETTRGALTPLPPRLAIVIGRESTGISDEVRWWWGGGLPRILLLLLLLLLLILVTARRHSVCGVVGGASRR